MNKLTRPDILSTEDYFKEREQRRKEVISLKKLRRIQLGDRLSFTFENRVTIKYQIQEMMRVERVSDDEKIQFEIDTYNALIPPPGALCATMFIEVLEVNQIKAILDTFQGLDKPGVVYMRVDSDKIPAEFEPGHSREDRISAVHYVMFRFNDSQIQRFVEGDVALHVEHPSYTAKTALTPEQKQEIAKDFQN